MLTKSAHHKISLYLLTLEKAGSGYSSKLVEIETKHLSRVDEHISSAHILANSLTLTDSKLSVNVELFIKEKLKFVIFEFSNLNLKFKEKTQQELLFSSLDVPDNIADMVKHQSNPDVLNDVEIDSLLATGQLERVGAEVVAKDHGEFKHNLSNLKRFIDKKLESLVQHVESAVTENYFTEKIAYLESLEKLCKFVSSRRELEVARNREIRGDRNDRKEDRLDLEMLYAKIDEIVLMKTRVRYLLILTKFNVIANFQIKCQQITKEFEFRKLKKAEKYENCFDAVERKYINSKDMLIEKILKSSKAETKYPFASKEDVFLFMSQSVTKSALDFVMIYLLLEIFGYKEFNFDIVHSLGEVENLNECIAYWMIDSCYSLSDTTEVKSKLDKSLRCFNELESNEIELSGLVLQAYLEIGLKKYSQLF